MKVLGFIFLSAFAISSAQASGSPEMQCWLGLKVKKYSKEQKKYLTVKNRIGLYFSGLERMDEDEYSYHHPVSGEIMFQIEGSKDKNGYINVKDMTDLNPKDVDHRYGDYVFADKKGKELKNPTFSVDFVSNSGSTVHIHLTGKKEYGPMKGTAYIDLSGNDRGRLYRSMDNLEGDEFNLSFELEKLKVVPIVCSYEWS